MIVRRVISIKNAQPLGKYARNCVGATLVILRFGILCRDDTEEVVCNREKDGANKFVITFANMLHNQYQDLHK